jgi:hypothetical protein
MDISIGSMLLNVSKKPVRLEFCVSFAVLLLDNHRHWGITFI